MPGRINRMTTPAETPSFILAQCRIAHVRICPSFYLYLPYRYRATPGVTGLFFDVLGTGLRFFDDGWVPDE